MNRTTARRAASSNPRGTSTRSCAPGSNGCGALAAGLVQPTRASWRRAEWRDPRTAAGHAVGFPTGAFRRPDRHLQPAREKWHPGRLHNREILFLVRTGEPVPSVAPHIPPPRRVGSELPRSRRSRGLHRLGAEPCSPFRSHKRPRRGGDTAWIFATQPDSRGAMAGSGCIAGAALVVLALVVAAPILRSGRSRSGSTATTVPRAGGAIRRQRGQASPRAERDKLREHAYWFQYQGVGDRWWPSTKAFRGSGSGSTPTSNHVLGSIPTGGQEGDTSRSPSTALQIPSAR